MQSSKPSNKPTGRQAKQQATEPIGVLQSLTSGFDFVTRHPDLMLPSILLDVFLWLGPRLSAYPLFTALLDFMNSPDMREALGPAQAQQVDAMQKLIDQAGKRSTCSGGSAPRCWACRA